MSTLQSTKRHPYRIQVTLLYWHRPWIRRGLGGVVSVAIGPAARELGVSTFMLKEYFRDLDKVGLLTLLQVNRGELLVTVTPPLSGAA